MVGVFLFARNNFLWKLELPRNTRSHKVYEDCNTYKTGDI